MCQLKSIYIPHQKKLSTMESVVRKACKIQKEFFLKCPVIRLF